MAAPEDASLTLPKYPNGTGQAECIAAIALIMVLFITIYIVRHRRRHPRHYPFDYDVEQACLRPTIYSKHPQYVFPFPSNQDKAEYSLTSERLVQSEIAIEAVGWMGWLALKALKEPKNYNTSAMAPDVADVYVHWPHVPLGALHIRLRYKTVTINQFLAAMEEELRWDGDIELYLRPEGGEPMVKDRLLKFWLTRAHEIGRMECWIFPVGWFDYRSDEEGQDWEGTPEMSMEMRPVSKPVRSSAF